MDRGARRGRYGRQILRAGIDQIVQGFSLDEPFTLRSTAALGNLSAFNLYHKRIHLAICLASWLLHTQQPLLLTTRSGKIANLV